MQRKPIIGITASYDANTLDTFVLRQYYVSAIENAGGIPLILPYCEPKNMSYYLDISDGILFSGGGDIDPVIFGEKMIKECKTPIKVRDDFDLVFFKKAFKKNIPILAICRGVQVANVVMGGTLWQDLPSQTEIKHSHYQKEGREDTTHDVTIEKDSLLYSIIGRKTIPVNSFHHQAIKAPAPGGIITAFSDDNVSECLEFPDRNAFFLGLQWHPESLCKIDYHNKIFKAFVAASKKAREEK